MTGLVWFRSDLRVTDNPALQAACTQHKDVMAVFCVTLEQWSQHDLGVNKLGFIRDSLLSLQGDLARLGIPLRIEAHPTFQETSNSLQSVLREIGGTALYFNCEYELNEVQRDALVCEAVLQLGVVVHQFHDQAIFAPGTLRNLNGAFYRVYTPFRKAWMKQVSQAMLKPLAKPKSRPTAGLASAQAVKDHNISDVFPVPSYDLSQVWPAGASAAQGRLKQFISDRSSDYHSFRDFPAAQATSSLSPYLAVGAISLRQCLWAAMDANQGRLEGGSPGLATWVNELIWREFYKHIVRGFPDVCRHKPFKPETAAIPWQRDQQRFDSWCQGRTGYPLVDAAMRQLNQTGWMHNRLRMVTAMFLTKHLLIDWRYGERYFMRMLVDADFSANNGGWQWSASTGADAAPYFRVFNPTRQSQRFDPEGHFIRKFVPELGSLDKVSIHAPKPLECAALGYPAPIVDHALAVSKVKALFQSVNHQQQLSKAQDLRR